MYATQTLQAIRDCFTHKDIWGVTEMSEFLDKDRSLIHRYIKELLIRGEIKSIGLGSHTRYKKTAKMTLLGYNHLDTIDSKDKYFDYTQNRILDEYFFKFAPDGEILTGKEGFIRRCGERNFDPKKKIITFVKLTHYIEKQKNNCGLLDVSAHFREHIEGSAIDKLFFADQYKRMEFGRGKLAELTFYAKDTQSMKLIRQSINSITNQLECLISTSKVDAIAFTPHSKKRHIQLLKELQKKIDLQGLPLIKLIKYAPYGTIIAQKSLKTRAQRIHNARQTILVEDNPHLGKKYKKVLLIDDFVGSGATLNETAKKLKSLGVREVIGFAWVGNANLSYEVINEI